MRLVTDQLDAREVAIILNELQQVIKNNVAGDVVEMEITGLGKLSNTIVKEESDFSILAKKKFL